MAAGHRVRHAARDRAARVLCRCPHRSLAGRAGGNAAVRSSLIFDADLDSVLLLSHGEIRKQAEESEYGKKDESDLHAPSWKKFPIFRNFSYR